MRNIIKFFGKKYKEKTMRKFCYLFFAHSPPKEFRVASGKPFHFFIVLFLAVGICSLAAQDLIILKDGNVIEAKVTEISPSEIRYKRIGHLDGPTIVVPASNVLSIRYENGTVDIINASPAAGNAGSQTGGAVSNIGGQPVLQSALQTILNAFPAIPIAGNNLKFQFSGDNWTATVNGENFSAGTVELEDTDVGSILTLKQTHIWPGAAGKTAAMIPGGGAIGGVLNAAGSIVGAAGAVEASGPEIVLEYIQGPSASLKLRSVSDGQKPARSSQPGIKTANARNNWLSFKLEAVGLGLRYERMLGPKTSLGLDLNFLPVYIVAPPYFDTNAFFHVYPWGKTFFLGAGLGYGTIADYYNGFTVTPEIGWKIDVGKVGGFYLTPGFTFPVVFSAYGPRAIMRFAYFGLGGSF
jgi:hypothetical protein